LDKLAGWAIRHRLIVALSWLAITIAGVAIAPSLSGRLVDSSNGSGPAATANAQIARRYGGVTMDPGALILNIPAGETVGTPRVRAELEAVDTAIAKAAPDLRLVSYAATGSQSLLGTGGRSTIVLAYPPRDGQNMGTGQLDALIRAATIAAPELTAHGTGIAALQADGPARRGNSSVSTELIIGALGALIVLAWVFGSLLALLPLIMALISVLTMQLFVYALTYIVPSSSPINPAVQYIVALLGLGLSIDYSLLIVTRWREERAAGRDNDEAVRTAVKRAGRSVGFSGVVASLGLLALIVIPNSVVRGIGISGLFIPSTATAVALTLLPAVLSSAGPRLDWPRWAARRARRGPSRFWTGWATLVIRHRIAAAFVGLGILAVLAGTAATINIGLPTASALATPGSRYTDGLHTLEADGFPSGTLTAVPVYVPHAADANAIVTSLNTVASLRGAVSPAGAGWHSDGSAMVIAIPRQETGTSQGGTSLADIQRTVPPGVLAGGAGALQIGQSNATYGSFPLLFALVALVTFLLLARGMKSILVPAKAVLLNALSVAASYGILVLVFQRGIGMRALWGASPYGAVETLVPLLIFGFLFGVSMDYEVFILTRIREGYERTRSTREGIIEGVSRTGRLVTSAAVILFFALASLSTAKDATVREIAAGMAAGVVLDAIVVRMLLVPALVSLLGDLNWWLPPRAARLLFIKPAGPAGPAGHGKHPVTLPATGARRGEGS
jgi:RND superfamily putative drug exporter